MNTNRAIFWVSVMLCLVLASPLTVAAERGIKLAGNRHALVIGNGNYRSSPLKNPVNDALDMSAALRRLGFSVTVKTDADQRVMEDAIRQLGRTLTAGGVGLFYYAGHGIQVQGRNYLIPVGADIVKEPDVKYEAVDAGRVLAYMEDAGNNLNIIILDACRDNPFARSFRSGDKGLARMDAPTGSIVAYATSPGSVAADGSGRNGLYTAKLLKHMLTPGITIERALKNVRIEVASASNRKQIPWESSSLMGDFYFTSEKKVNTASKSVPKKKPERIQVNNTELNPDTVKREDRTRLAILPWLLSRDGSVYIDSVLNKLSAEFEDHKNFTVKYSYYPIKDLPGINILNDETIHAGKKIKLWKRKLLSSEPDIDAICDLARRLDYDSAIIGVFDVPNNLVEYLCIYYIDVRTRELVKYKERNLGYTSQGALSTDFTLKMKHFVKDVSHKFALSKK